MIFSVNFPVKSMMSQELYTQIINVIDGVEMSEEKRSEVEKEIRKVLRDHEYGNELESVRRDRLVESAGEYLWTCYYNTDCEIEDLTLPLFSEWLEGINPILYEDLNESSEILEQCYRDFLVNIKKELEEEVKQKRKDDEESLWLRLEEWISDNRDGLDNKYLRKSREELEHLFHEFQAYSERCGINLDTDTVKKTYRRFLDRVCFDDRASLKQTLCAHKPIRANDLEAFKDHFYEEYTMLYFQTERNHPDLWEEVWNEAPRSLIANPK